MASVSTLQEGYTANFIAYGFVTGSEMFCTFLTQPTKTSTALIISQSGIHDAAILAQLEDSEQVHAYGMEAMQHDSYLTLMKK